jgi:hypothetical protein
MRSPLQAQQQKTVDIDYDSGRALAVGAEHNILLIATQLRGGVMRAACKPCR